MLRRFALLTVAATLLIVVGLFPGPALAIQDKNKEKPAEQEKNQDKNKEKDGKTPTAEQVAETVILVYGTRQGLAQIRRNGVERGRVTRTTNDGRTEEITYEQRFVRGENSQKDKVRLDQKLPSMEYALIYNDGRVWGVINGTPFTPRQDAAADFLAQTHYGIDALLRYKENGATITFVTKEKQKNIDMWVLDLTDKESRRIRYYISAKTGRVLWLEYDQTPAGDQPVRFKKTFHDYRYAQSTLVPYRTELYADGKLLQETRVLTVTFGIKMDDAYFQSSETAATAP